MMPTNHANRTQFVFGRKVAKNRVRNTKRNQRASSSFQFGYQTLEPRNLLATLVGDYVDDFNSGPDSNWEYFWNDAGSLSDPDNFEMLSPWTIPIAGTTFFTPGGTATPNGPSANQLRLGRVGSHPGAVGHYAIAGFTVDDSGYYSIEDSFVSLYNSIGDGIEFKVFVDGGPLLNEGTVEAVGDSRTYFDTELGFLAADSKVFVAFGAGATDGSDFFSTDYSIFRHEDREIVVEPTQGTSGGTWEHVVEHSGLYGIRDTTPASSSANNVLVNGDMISNEPNVNDYVQLDGSLGYLKQGDTITIDASGQTVDDGIEVVRVVPRTAPDLSFVQDGTQHFVITVPDNPTNPVQTIGDAIIAARQKRTQQIAQTASDGIQRSVEIQLSPGTYHLDASDRQDTHFFQLWNVDNLVINGNGATFTTNDVFAGLFSTGNVRNTVFRDFTFDYAEYSTSSAGNFYKPVGFTQGEILGINSSNNTVRIEVDTAEFLAPDDELTVNGNLQPRFRPQNPSISGKFWGFPVKQDSNGRVADNAESFYPTSNATWVSGNGRYQTFDILLNVHGLSADEFSIGDTYVMQRRDTTPAFRLVDSANVTVERVTAYSAPGVFVTSRGSKLNNVLDSHVMIRPTSDDVTSTRVTSANGDAVHVQSDRDGLWIEDSTFNGVSDDVMNFYSLPAVVHNVQGGGNTLTIGEVNVDSEVIFSVRSLYEVGDILVFVDPVEGTVLAKARITNVEDLRATGVARFVVTLDQAVTGITQWDGIEGGSDTMVFNTSINKGFVVQDSELTNSRRFGNFVMANNVDLVDNVYSGLPDQAIAGHSELDWPHGPYAKNVLVQGNHFSDIGFSRQASTQPYYHGAVAFFMDRIDDTDSVTAGPSVPNGVYEIENIQIRDNVFIDWSEKAIVVLNAQRVTIADNHIYAPNETDVNDASRAFLIEKSVNVTIGSNTFDDDLLPVLLGDVNLDGEVTFLDISPFINLLTTGGFQAEADIDDDGLVTFMDIQPFIDILNSQ